MEPKNMSMLVIMLVVLGCCGGRVSCDIVQFIFGDSLSDVGNNNYLPKSLARATLPWYGIDFGNGLPNGRFTNGRTVADIVGDMMGLPRPPAFLDPKLDEDTILAKGVNYASGAGGILNETSILFRQRFSMYKQIELFEGTKELIRRKMGENETEKFFMQARYVVALGSNDFINNYLMPIYQDSWTYNDDSFLQLLTSTLEAQLRLLYSLGARELTFFGLGPMGCIPLQRLLTTSGQCQESTNQLSLRFNKESSQVLQKLSKELPNANFLYGDAYDVVQDVIYNPKNHGFNNTYGPCCSVPNIRPTLTCTPLSSLCSDRSKYVFWDEYHPTDRANEIIAIEISNKLGFKPINSSNTTQSPPSPSISTPFFSFSPPSNSAPSPQ